MDKLKKDTIKREKKIKTREDEKRRKKREKRNEK